MIESLKLTAQMSFKFPPPNHSSFITRITTTSNQNPTRTVVRALSGTTTNVPPVNTRKPEKLYQVLRLHQNASSAEIKTAYRNLVKHFHPDVAGSESSTSHFYEIQKAYETLYDPTTRERYDYSIQAEERGVRYQNKIVSSKVGNGYGGGLRTRRWETDQCW